MTSEKTINSSGSISSKIESFLDRLNEWLRPYVSVGPYKAAIYMALVVFCIERWPEPQLLMVCAFALMVHRFAFSALYWAGITAVYVVTHWIFWYFADNHWYLFLYWCLAITLSLCSPSPRESLAKSARWMLALIFLLSTFWKLASPEFLNGQFVEYAILADLRLSPIGLLTGLSGETLLSNRQILENFIHVSDPSSEAILTTTKTVPIAALLVSWWMLLLQGSVALAFLLPDRMMNTFRRHVPMLVFLYTTYPLAQVSGFGWTLTGMALCQLKPKDKPIYLALYLGAFLMIFISKNPGIRGILHHLNVL